MLSELLSANLCTPFLLKMVEGFFLDTGRTKDTETEASVGLWTGNLVSVFFITQFFTSLLWSSIADRHGRRAVIVASLAGSALALMVFGTSESVRRSSLRASRGIMKECSCVSYPRPSVSDSFKVSLAARLAW
jgi:MFS family permease